MACLCRAQMGRKWKVWSHWAGGIFMLCISGWHDIAKKSDIINANQHSSGLNPDFYRQFLTLFHLYFFGGYRRDYFLPTLPLELTSKDRCLMLRFMACLSPKIEDLIIRANIFRVPSHLLGKPHVCCSAPIQGLSQSLEGQPGSSDNTCLYLPSGFQCYLRGLRGEFANISQPLDPHGRQQFVNCQKHLSKEALIPWIHLSWCIGSFFVSDCRASGFEWKQ